MTTFKIFCRAGLISFGGSTDFLVCISKAIDAKRNTKKILPGSTLIVQIYYPNGSRVPLLDIKSALAALSNEAVSHAVAMRRTALPQKAPARSEASTAAFSCAGAVFFARRFASVFCQAGVVAPPDSPTDGNFTLSSSHNF
nr:hypothetical protein [uncultured Undibacterium sp.]